MGVEVQVLFKVSRDRARFLKRRDNGKGSARPRRGQDPNRDRVRGDCYV